MSHGDPFTKDVSRRKPRPMKSCLLLSTSALRKGSGSKFAEIPSDLFDRGPDMSCWKSPMWASMWQRLAFN